MSQPKTSEKPSILEKEVGMAQGRDLPDSIGSFRPEDRRETRQPEPMVGSRGMVFSLNRLIPRDAMADREGSAPETRWRRVLGATALLFHSRKHNFGIAFPPGRCKFAKSGAELFQQAINFEAPARPGERECSSGYFEVVVCEAIIDDEVIVHSRCYLLFDNRIRSECAAQGRQQTARSDKAERADGLQTRWNGPGHKALGW